MVTARFTPSLLDEAALEDLFVHRHHLVDSCVAMIERAAASDERGARLFVGPRGAGKTHLISLVYHRANRLDSFGTGFQLAWLPEDPWTIDTFDELIAQIVQAIEPACAGHGRGEKELLRLAAQRGPVVVLAENLDQILDGLGGAGQRSFRALIENSGALVLVATTTRLSAALTSQAEPFYGFFDTTVLEPFTVDMAQDMLRRIAKRNGDQELADFLDTPLARRRLAAIEHLAGGQPRVWALLASGLTITELDQLVDALIERFDDLTPYYQAQMQLLSRNERRVVKALTDRDGSVTVKALAEQTGIAPTSLAKTLSDLRKRGWVRPRNGPIVAMADGRNTYYELAEPLARLAFQLKQSRGEPVRLVVDFLKLWFDRAEIEEASSAPAVRALPYLTTALESLTGDPAALVANRLAGRPTATDLSLRPLPEVQGSDATRLAAVLSALDNALRALSDGDPEQLLNLPAAVSHMIEADLANGASLSALRLDLVDLGLSLGGAAESLRRIDDLLPALDEHEKARALRAAIVCHVQLGQLAQAEAILSGSWGWGGTTDFLHLYGLVSRTIHIGELSRDSVARRADLLIDIARTAVDRVGMLGFLHPPTIAIAIHLLAQESLLLLLRMKGTEVHKRWREFVIEAYETPRSQLIDGFAKVVADFESNSHLAITVFLGGHLLLHACEEVLGDTHVAPSALRGVLGAVRARPVAPAGLRDLLMLSRAMDLQLGEDHWLAQCCRAELEVLRTAD